jgi:tripartite-type tricarboxylate transporter receptor subunit TctC
LLGPPGIPAERVRALRAAFAATMRDPGYLADISKLGLQTVSSTGEEADALVRRFLSYPKPVLERARAGLHEKP